MPLTVVKKLVSKECCVAGCSAMHSDVLIRISNGEGWAFAKLCISHASTINGVEDAAIVESQLKGRNTGPLKSELLRLEHAYCPRCQKDLVDWKNKGATALDIGRWSDCFCEEKHEEPATATIEDPKETEKETEKETIMETTTKTTTTKATFTKTMKTHAYTAAKRVAVTQSTKAFGAAIRKGLEAQGSDVSLQAAAFLETPFGEALLAGMAGVVLQQFGDSIPGISAETKSAITDELIVQAMTTAGNETMSLFAGPMMEAIASLAPAMEKVEKTRVALEAPEQTTTLAEVEVETVEAIEATKASLKQNRGKR